MTSIKTLVRAVFVSTALVLGGSAALAAATVDVTQSAALHHHGALLLDVRTPGEFAQAHAPGATLIPLGQLRQRLGELGSFKDRPIAVICHSDSRLAVAQNILEKTGLMQTV